MLKRFGIMLAAIAALAQGPALAQSDIFNRFDNAAVQSEKLNETVGEVLYRPTNMVRQVIAGGTQNMAGTYTAYMALAAPADYDAVQLVMSSATNDAVNPYKCTISAPARINDRVNGLDSAGSAITPTAVTWGTTSVRNPRNPGGGAATMNAAGASGTNPTVIEGQVYSDIMPLSSLARTDTVGAKPLLFVRCYGVNLAAIQEDSLATNATNPIQGVIPEFFCAYSGSDFTATASGVAVPPTGQQNFCPAVEVIYYLRGQRAYGIASAGDSIDQGWCGATAVNCSAGRVDGYVHKLVRTLNAKGTPAGYTAWNRAGYYSYRFNEHALTAMLNDCAPGITHLFYKPYSVNEGGLTASQISADIRRAEFVLAQASRCGIKPILVYPWAGQGNGNAAQIAMTAFIDAAAARGVATLDARSIVNDGGLASNTIKPSCLTVTNAGATVDTTHINDACQSLIAQRAFNQRRKYRIE